MLYQRSQDTRGANHHRNDVLVPQLEYGSLSLPRSNPSEKSTSEIGLSREHSGRDQLIMNTNSSTKPDAQRVWLITGTSRGFGAEIAKSALAAGDTVAGTARRPEDVAKSLGKSDRLLAVRMDVADPESVRAGVEAVIAQFGRIDVLVNNAGYGLLGSIEEASPEEVEGVFRTNVFGLLNVTRAVLPHMRSRRSGRLIHFSSIGGYESFVGWGIYCATKFAVEAISEALSAELAPLGIYSTVVEPGFFGPISWMRPH